jgi:NADH-quinone oxidoreductase subunit N
MAILMFSMSGIPPMAGFFGKLFVFQAAINSGLYILAVIGVLSSVVAAYYYVRIIKVMFFDDAAENLDRGMDFARGLVLFISLFFVLAFIFKPSYIVTQTQVAAAVLFPG